MKKLIFILVFIGSSAIAQQTATITDSDGIVWINGTWSATLICPAGQPTVNRIPLTAQQQYAQGTLNGSGALSATLIPTNTLDQSGATWKFTINPNAGVMGNIVSTTVTSTTQNLTSILSAGTTAPRFPANATAFGYADVEIYPTPALGATYYNTTTPTLRQFSLNGWTSPASGGGAGTVTTVGATGNAIVAVNVTNPTTTPLIVLTLPNQAANCALGNFTGSAAAPSCSSTPQFNGVNITGLNFTQLGGTASIAQLPATVMQTVGTATANVILKRTTSNTSTDSSLTDNGTAITTAEPITAASFTGPLVGNATTATTATNLPGGLLGSMPYQSAAATTAMLAGSTSSALAVLTQTGTGTISAVPAWNATTGTGVAVFATSPTITAPTLSGTTNSGPITANGALTTNLSLVSTRATGTAPLTITSVTPVANMVVAKHPTELYCGTTVTCSATAQTGGQIVYGTVQLSSGAAIVTGISPAFADLLYSCTATVKAAAIVTNVLAVANTSTSSITITGAAASSDIVSYICIR